MDILYDFESSGRVPDEDLYLGSEEEEGNEPQRGRNEGINLKTLGEVLNNIQLPNFDSDDEI